MLKIFRIICVFIKIRWFDKWTSREKIEKYQEKMLKKQMKYFEKKSPYFKAGKFSKNDTMNKEFMMKNFDELNTVGVKKEKAFKIAIESEKKESLQKNIKISQLDFPLEHRDIVDFS